MAFSEIYRRQVDLLVRALPYVAEEHCFALKGGTAINLFVRDLPRLSVDIDLAYVPVEPRPDSLAAISGAMRRIGERIRQRIAGSEIIESQSEGAITKLFVVANNARIKIEVTPVLRGCVYEPGIRPVSARVEDEFGFAEISVVSFSDLYGGKTVAALDRQHPRDLFDVRDLLANEGIDENLRRAFIVYMLSHNRPMCEVLTARRQDIALEFERGFVGMTSEPVRLDELIDARERLITGIVGNMPAEHREFLISFEEGKPDWALLDLPRAADLPAVRWRQQNLDSLDAGRRSALVDHLKRVLFP